MKISDSERQDLFKKMVTMAEETLKDKDNGKYHFIIDLQDGVPVKLSEILEIKYYTRINKKLVAANSRKK